MKRTVSAIAVGAVLALAATGCGPVPAGPYGTGGMKSVIATFQTSVPGQQVGMELTIETLDPDLIITDGRKYADPIIYTKTAPFEQPVLYEAGAQFVVTAKGLLIGHVGDVVYCNFIDTGGVPITRPDLPTNPTLDELLAAAPGTQNASQIISPYPNPPEDDPTLGATVVTCIFHSPAA